MGKHFGELAKYSNIIQYSLSAHEQRAFAGFFKQGFPNLIRRFKSKALIWIPPFVLIYYIHEWAIKENENLKRKQPGQFDNDL